MQQRLSLIICCLLLYVSAAAQKEATPPALRRANIHYDNSLRLMGKKNTEQAISEMKYALKEWPALADAYSQLGAWYFKARRYDEAIAIFDQAAANLKNGERDFALPKARSLVLSGRMNEAQTIISKYITGKPKDPWTALKKQADFAANAMAHPTTFSVFNIGCNINTLDAEVYPYISSDGQTLYFTRRVNGVDEDFFMATADTSCDEKWSIAENLGRPPNTPNQESAQMISADGHYLFFTRCENRNVNGWESGGCDLYMAYRIAPDSAWSIPESFGPTINSAAFEGMPCLSPDNRELYFVSDRPGGYGGMDIWVSKFEDGLWQVPQNLSAQVNTKGNETSPFLHIDNHTLFFSSDGHEGMGGSDLYYTTKIKDTEWTTPKNLGYPINSMADEGSISVSVDGKTAYFSSDRHYNVGNFDLYETTLPFSFHPLPVAVIKGYVYDSISKEKLNYASIYVNDPVTGLPIYHFQSNRGDGSFMITLPQGAKYALLSDRIGYLENNDTLSLLRTADNIIHIEHNIPLLTQDYVKPVSDTMVLVLHFPVNSSSLSDSDKMVIKNAMSSFLGTKNMTVYVNGFADTTGTPLINEQLSFNRAKLVATEVAALGVDNDLIKYQGWGEANPIATNSTEEGRSKNRRVEIIIRH